MKNFGEFQIHDIKEIKKLRSSSMKPLKNHVILQWFQQNTELLLILYMVVYSIVFYLLEKRLPNDGNYTSMYCALDDMIPFCEYFLIPYYIWHPFVALTVAYFLFTNTKDYLRSCLMLFGGMTVCCIIYYFFPNGQNLRPAIDTLRDNIFTTEIKRLWEVDTCTNVCPSIHVYNSLACWIVI